MEYTYLGRSGLSVSRLVLGTMSFGPETSEEDSHAIMDRAHEHGMNFSTPPTCTGKWPTTTPPPARVEATVVSPSRSSAGGSPPVATGGRRPLTQQTFRESR